MRIDARRSVWIALVVGVVFASGSHSSRADVRTPARASSLDIAYRMYSVDGRQSEIFLASSGDRRRIRVSPSGRSVSAPAWRDASTLSYVLFRSRTPPLLISLTFSGDGRRIAEQSEETLCGGHLSFARNGSFACLDTGDEPDIWAFSSGGDVLAHIYDEGAADAWKDGPAISPDGRRLAYVSQGYLSVADLVSPGGMEPREQLCCLRSPSWSPDGALIAFARICGEYRPCGLWIVRSDGTRPRRVLGWGVNPAWSPDGRRLAFDGVRRRGEGRAVYTVRIDGTGLTRVSPHVRNRFELQSGLGQSWRPR